MEQLHYFGVWFALDVLQYAIDNCKNPIVKFWIKPIFNGVLAIGNLSCALFLASSAFAVEQSVLLIDPIKNLGKVDVGNFDEYGANYYVPNNFGANWDVPSALFDQKNC